MGGGYFPIDRCVSTVENPTSDDLHLLVDNNTRTCVNTHIMQNGVGLSLQVSFSFPISGFGMKFLSVEVVFQGSVDCKSIAWIWFVGSNSSTGNFKECHKGLVVQDTDSTSCLVTCPCVNHCVTIYFKHGLVFFAEQKMVVLCEVLFRPGSIVPGGPLTTHVMGP